ncbi:MAG: MotA/TolQ/ExbB proton channel family protein [Campylobacter sp.]
MDIRNDAFSELILPEVQSRQGALVYAKIIALPVFIYLVVLAGYFGYIDGFEIGLHTVVLMGAILLVALVFGRNSAELAYCYFEQSGSDFKRSLKEYIINHLLVIGKETKSNAGFDDFVAHYTRNLRNENFASVGAGVFPMLGILGTFVSIAISMPSFSSSNVEGLETEIANLLGGVGTAFYVSIYGIFLALWWIFFEKYGTSRFESLVSVQKASTSAFFWTKEEIDRKYFEENLKYFEKMGTIFEYVCNQEFFVELDKTINNKFRIFTDIMQNERDAVKISSENIRQTMNTLLRSSKDQKDLVKVHADILNAVGKFNNNFKDMQVKFSEQYNRLYDVGSERITRLERSVADIEGSIRKFNLSLQGFSAEILEQQSRAMDGFKNSLVSGMQAFREVFDDEANSAYSDKTSDIDELKKDFDEIDKQANEILQTIEQTNQDENK